MFKHIKCTELPVFDQDRARAFYTDKVGLKIALDASYQPDWCWIELEVAENSTRILFSQRADENPEAAPALNLVTDDVKEVYEKLSKNEVVFTQKPAAAPWNPGETYI